MTLPPGADPEHIAALVRRCPLVADLHPGRFGEAATYLPHHRVIGVQLRPGEVGVHVTALYPASITEVDTQLRAALEQHLAGMALTITIEDYASADQASANQPAANHAPPATPDPDRSASKENS